MKKKKGRNTDICVEIIELNLHLFYLYALYLNNKCILTEKKWKKERHLHFS